MDATQLLKGVLDAAVLAVISKGDGYGYDVIKRLQDSGLTEVGDASVYGTLRRLFTIGALTSYVVPSESGPHRKYYGITPLGLQMLSEQREVWQEFASAMCALLGTTHLILPTQIEKGE
ncbi:MAG: PadR family transcriptional regulator [Cellulomonadaceae bacterium]|nr:PadR family transcriptional regulator [Cellulomonadaceae bacterium]